MATRKRSEIPWASIEKDWRAGIKTKLQISREYKVSRAAMDKHFDKLGIQRDLKAQIRAEANAIVTKKVTAQTAGQEEEIVTLNAQMQADIIMSHRTDIQRYRKLCSQLLAEIEITSDNQDLFNTLGELLDKSDYDDNGRWKQDKQNEIYHRVISMSSRISGVKQLAEALKVLIGLERQAFGIADDGDGNSKTDPLQALLEQIDGTSTGLHGRAES
jgi:hypothetical protein